MHFGAGAAPGRRWLITRKRKDRQGVDSCHVLRVGARGRSVCRVRRHRPPYNSPAGLPTSAMQTAVRWNPRWTLRSSGSQEEGWERFHAHASHALVRCRRLRQLGRSGGHSERSRSAVGPSIPPEGARGCLLETGPSTLGSRLLRLRRPRKMVWRRGKALFERGVQDPKTPFPGTQEAPQPEPVTDLFAHRIPPHGCDEGGWENPHAKGVPPTVHRGARPAVRHLEPVQLCLAELVSFPTRRRSGGALAMPSPHPGWKPAPCACRLASTGWPKRFQCLRMGNQRLCTPKVQLASAPWGDARSPKLRSSIFFAPGAEPWPGWE